MQKIIVPTDFSTLARQALHYAIQLANHFDAEVHLLHFYEVRSRAGMLMNIRDFMRRDAEDNLAQEVAAVKTRMLPHAGLVARAVEGPTVDSIIAYAGSVKADMIVMGTQGASGLREIFLGTNAAGVLRKSKFPVLVIPRDCEYHPFRKVGLAIDDEILLHADILQPLLNIAKEYKAPIDLLHVDAPQGATKVLDPGYELAMEGTLHQSHRIANDNIHAGLKELVEEHKIDLLGMIRRQRSFIERLFQGSRTRREAFDSEVPLLILPELD